MRAPSTDRPAVWRYVAGALITLAALPLFALSAPIIGWAMLLAGVAVSFVAGRKVGLDLLPVAAGIGILTLLPAEPELGLAGMSRFTLVLAAALVIPWLISRFGTRAGGVTFPFRDGRRWGREQWIFLAVVPLLGYVVLPAYFIDAEGHANWPAVDGIGAIAMLTVGILGLGLWEELFFVGVVFSSLRPHVGAWRAIVLRAVVVVPLLWDWGFRGIGWVIILVFALVQGWIYERTKSLSYVIAVHLTFDLVMIAVLVWAKHPEWVDVFLTA